MKNVWRIFHLLSLAGTGITAFRVIPVLWSIGPIESVVVVCALLVFVLSVIEMVAEGRSPFKQD